MTDQQKQDDHTEPTSEPTMKEMERLHSAVMAIELQLQDIGAHHPQILGMALLAMSTFMVEKIYTISATADNANALLAAAQEAGLQNRVDQEERARHSTDNDQRIMTLDE
jgi:hypothetical protein